MKEKSATVNLLKAATRFFRGKEGLLLPLEAKHNWESVESVVTEGMGYLPPPTTTTTALFSPQMLKIIIVYSRLTQLQNKEDHGHPKIAGASRVK